MATDLTNVAVSTGYVQLLHIDGGVGGSATRVYDGDGTGTPLEISTTELVIKDGSFNLDVASHDGTNGLKLGGTLVTTSAAELNLLDGITAGTVSASKFLLVDSNKDLTGLRNLTATGTIQAANFTGTGNTQIGDAAADTVAMNATITTNLIFEGSTDNAYETTLAITDPTADRTWTIPDATDTSVGRATTDTLTNKTLTAPDINTPDIDGGTVDAITSLTVANSVDIGNYTLTANGLTIDGTFTDGTLSIASGSISSAVNGTFSGTVQAEQLTTTDDATISDQLSVDGTMTISTGSIVDSTGTISFGNENLTTTGVGTFASLDISGNADIDGTMEADAYTVDGTALNEYIADTVGAMVGSNTETNITVTYEDGDNTLDFVIGTLNQDTTGTADNFTVSANNSNDETVYPIFVDGATGSQGAESDTGLTYNPSSGMLTISGELDAGSLDISGNADIDGTLEADAITVDGTTLAEYISDTAGAMFSSNTESGITVTFQDGDNTVDLSVDAAQTGITSLLATDIKIGEDDQTKIDFEDADKINFYAGNEKQLILEDGALYPGSDNIIDLGKSDNEFKDAFFDGTVTADAFAGPITGAVTGNADTATLATTVTVSDSTANTNFPVVFHNESNALLDDTGALRYNPSTGELLVPKLTVAGTTTTVDTVTMKAQNAIVFEGATDDSYETTLSIVDPTSDHTQYLINQGGYIPVLAAATTTAISATPAELNVLDGVTAGTVLASSGVVVDSNKDIGTFRNITLSGELDAATLDISGDADIDGTLEADAITVNGTALATYIRDTVGENMISSNTESGITVTYDTSNDNIDFAVDAAQTGITSLLATDIKIGEDDQTKIDFETADEIHFYAANAEQVYVADGVFGPQTDSDVDLGSNSVRWKDAYVDSVTSTGAISGTTGTFTGNITMADDTSIGISDSDERIEFDASGDISVLGANFGIGTDSPSANLEIEDGGTSNSLLLKVTADDGNPYGIVIGNDSFSTTDTHGLRMHVNDSGSGFIDARGSGDENLLLQPNGGRVGIGTDSPDTILDIRQSSDGAGAEVKIVNTAGTGSSDETVEINAQHTTSEYVGGKIQFFRSGDYSTTGQRQGGIKLYTCDNNSNAVALTLAKDLNATFAGAIIQSMSNPYTKMIDTSSGGDDYGLNNNDSKFSIYNWTDGREELYFGGDGNATFAGAITINTSTSEQLMLKGATSPYLRFYESTTAKAYIQWHSDGYLNLENSEASTNLAVGANGVGIGVTAPKTALEVGGAGGAHVTLSHTPTNASDIADNDLLGQIDFAGYDTDYSGDFIIGARIKAQVDGTWDASGGGNVADAPTELQFITVNSDTSHDIDHATNLNMVIKSDGKVGIGTTAPDVSLDVMSSDNFKNILLSTSKSDDTDQYVGIAMQHETSAEEDICIVSGDSQDGVSILTIGGGQAVYNTFEQIRFYTASTDTTTTGTERMRIKSDGALTLVEKANAIANSLRFQGLETVGDDEAQNYTMDGTCCIVILANHSSEDAALFFMSYASATITKIADPSNEYDTSATDGKSCIYKSSNSATFTIENKRGGARNMGVAQIAVTSAV